MEPTSAALPSSRTVIPCSELLARGARSVASRSRRQGRSRGRRARGLRRRDMGSAKESGSQTCGRPAARFPVTAALRLAGFWAAAKQSGSYLIPLQRRCSESDPSNHRPFIRHSPLSSMNNNEKTPVPAGVPLVDYHDRTSRMIADSLYPAQDRSTSVDLGDKHPWLERHWNERDPW